MSMIVPVYNVELYLKECLDSIINQSYSNLEIILIDDGSTDSSGKICDEYAKLDKRVSVIHKANGGLSSARNCGIDVAKGEYISFVDSDDWLESNHIKDFIDKVSPNSIVCCGFSERYKNKTIVNSPMQEERLTNLEYLDKFISSTLQAHLGKGQEFIGNFAWNKMYPKSIFRELRYPEGMQYEDIYVCIDVFKQVKFVKILPRANYNYRMREKSIVHTQTKKNLFDYINSKIKQENDLSEYRDIFYKAKINTFHSILSLAVLKAKKVIDLDVIEEKELRNMIIKRWKDIPLKFWKAHVKAVLYLFCPTLLRHVATLYSYRQKKHNIYER